MNELIQLTRIGLAATFNFYTKVHGFHWNVEGPDFYEFHKLFQKIYEEVYEAVDPYAENIRKLGAYVPANYYNMNILTKIDDEGRVPSKEEMVEELVLDSQKMQIILKKNYDAAEAAGEHGLSNFLAERINAHLKHEWFLRSSIKQG